ncbi:conserved exported hypothetical protein [Thiomonas arsenitoxydans]|uniref:Uncharacterized protein n=2 Tax=Thiomonas arsenitoxydans (strain DSM 22701 / CIP 110005 / 3As) TaxID=426114 RepID=A0ABM9T5H3_THIA3|nr:conserved exported hypothetical protein [Thiomonas arsenitoxydans]CQR33437.1 conserved exported hypothetical protein [Thiomonas arsenitoxydans]CQR33500.1 conserved exported hypothetical protein [Thiomonas arsenitoxydans]CQR39892.1 conserved exported hypothetical protein [Thiomonas arsenitoxydans]
MPIKTLTRRFVVFPLPALLLGALLLTGCGGGGSSTASPSADQNSALTSSSTTPSSTTPSSTTPSSTTPSSTAPSGTASNSSSASPSAPTNNVGVVNVAAHALKVDVSGIGTSPMTTPPVNTPASGSIILVQVLTQNTGTFSSLTDNKGNTYTRIGNAQTYAGVGAGSYLYACVNAKGGTGQTWSLNKTSSYEDNEATLFVVVLSGASALGDWTYSDSRSNDSAKPLTTTGPNSLVVSFWGPADFTGSQSDPTNVYNAPVGWTRLDMGNNSLNSNSGADAWQTVSYAGTAVNPEWSAETAINNPTSSMWLVEVKP